MSVHAVQQPTCSKRISSIFTPAFSGCGRSAGLCCRLTGEAASSELISLGASFFQRLTRVGKLPLPPLWGNCTDSPIFSSRTQLQSSHVNVSRTHTLLAHACCCCFFYISNTVLALKFLFQSQLLGKLKVRRPPLTEGETEA